MFEIRVSSRNEGRLRRNVCRGGVCGYNTLGLESPSYLKKVVKHKLITCKQPPDFPPPNFFQYLRAGLSHHFSYA